MENNKIAKHQNPVTVKGLLSNINYKKRFEDILGKKAPGFISSIINVSQSPSLKDCDPGSIIGAAVVAATLDLPIDQNLGFSYLVPYNDKKKGKIAQFQMGYKGFIQLAMRSGQYKTINACEVYEGDIKSFNRFTGEIEFNELNTNRDKIVGYIAYFRLTNGFEKYLYMTIDELERHGKEYSQSYKSKNDFISKNSLWATNFESMATKTVLKRLLSKFGILSIEMQKAVLADQAEISDNIIHDGDVSSNSRYVDNEVVDASYEVKEEINKNANKTTIEITNDSKKTKDQSNTTEQTSMLDDDEIPY